MHRTACRHVLRTKTFPVTFTKRPLSSSRHRWGTFDSLGRLAVSRETQWFTKASGLSRVEHSPPLELVRESEVKPFQKSRPPSKPQPAPAIPNLEEASHALENTGVKISTDAEAIIVGQKILQAKNAQIAQLERQLHDTQKLLRSSHLERTRLLGEESWRKYSSWTVATFAFSAALVALGYLSWRTRSEKVAQMQAAERPVKKRPRSSEKEPRVSVLPPQLMSPLPKSRGPPPNTTIPVRPVRPVSASASTPRKSRWSSLLWDTS